MKILVTGGAGFVGSHLVDRLIKENHKVVTIDNLSTGKKRNINPKAKFYKIDICNPRISDIFKKEKPEVIFHYAAHINARESVENSIFDAKINILGSLNVLENCRRSKVKKVFFASSGGEIYGAADKIPTPENYSLRPMSPYGVGKLAIEKYLDSYYQLFDLPYVILRYGNIYGPRQNPYGEAGVIAIFAAKMLRNKQPLIHGDGRQTKDYIFIDDAIEATVLSFKNNFRGILNIGTGKEKSVLEIFRMIKNLTNSRVKKKYIPCPPCVFKRGCLSIKKIKKGLGWRPRYPLNKGLEITVDWFKKNLK